MNRCNNCDCEYECGCQPSVAERLRAHVMAMAEHMASLDRAWAIAYAESALDPNNAEKHSITSEAADRANMATQELMMLCDPSVMDELRAKLEGK